MRLTYCHYILLSARSSEPFAYASIASRQIRQSFEVAGRPRVEWARFAIRRDRPPSGRRLWRPLRSRQFWKYGGDTGSQAQCRAVRIFELLSLLNHRLSRHTPRASFGSLGLLSACPRPERWAPHNWWGRVALYACEHTTARARLEHIAHPRLGVRHQILSLT